MSSARLARINPAMQGFIDNGTLIGSSARIMRRGETVFSGCWGQRDRENNKPMTEDTIFDLASLTKVVATTTSDHP